MNRPTAPGLDPPAPRGDSGGVLGPLVAADRSLGRVVRVGAIALLGYLGLIATVDLSSPWALNRVIGGVGPLLTAIGLGVAVAAAGVGFARGQSDRVASLARDGDRFDSPAAYLLGSADWVQEGRRLGVLLYVWSALVPATFAFLALTTGAEDLALWLPTGASVAAIWIQVAGVPVALGTYNLLESVEAARGIARWERGIVSSRDAPIRVPSDASDGSRPPGASGRPLAPGDLPGLLAAAGSARDRVRRTWVAAGLVGAGGIVIAGVSVLPLGAWAVGPGILIGLLGGGAIAARTRAGGAGRPAGVPTSGEFRSASDALAGLRRATDLVLDLRRADAGGTAFLLWSTAWSWLWASVASSALARLLWRTGVGFPAGGYVVVALVPLVLGTLLVVLLDRRPPTRGLRAEVRRCAAGVSSVESAFWARF